MPNTGDLADLDHAIELYCNKIRDTQKLERKDVDDMNRILETFAENYPKETSDRFQTAIKGFRDNAVKELRDLSNYLPGPRLDSVNTSKDGRFETLGFRPCTAIYKHTNTWDWHPIQVGILVPKNLDREKDIAIHVKWHGGAFGTSSWDFEPYFGAHILRHAAKNNAIILAPNYRLMPESGGVEILKDVDDFWQWYLGPGLSVALRDAGVDIAPNKNKLLVSGDSAGAWPALYSWISSQGKPYIRTLYLHYPMLRHYHRESSNSQEMNIGGRMVTRKEVEKNVDQLWRKVQDLHNANLCPTITKRTPPDGSICNTKLWFAHQWRTVFQRAGPTPDIIDQVLEAEVGNLPVVFIHHGTMDLNVPIEHTRNFVNKLKKTHYAHDTDRIHFHETEGESHGYDHNFNEEEHEWLLNILNEISTQWTGD